MSVEVDIDLRPLVGPVRDQRQRPTCLACAATAAHEASRRGIEYLSIEYLFYRGVRRSHKDPTRGLSQVSVAEVLKQDGQPEEAAWPYLPVTPDVATWVPPSMTSNLYRTMIVFARRTVGDVRGAIISGAPVILIISLTTAMYRPDAHGIIRPRPTDVATTDRHGVLGVGSGHLSGSENYILIRNTWGSKWGDCGHGWLPDSYLGAHLEGTGVVASEDAVT